MSGAKKSDKEKELEQIEDALAEFMLSASNSDIDEMIAADGHDLGALVEIFDSIVVAAKAKCGKERLARARRQLEEFAANSVPIGTAEREEARQCFTEDRLKVSRAPQQLLLAARKGQGASERDIDSLVDDYAELARLEKQERERQPDQPGASK